MSAVTEHDPSRVSHYVDAAFYERLRQELRLLDGPLPAAGAEVSRGVETFLHREARMLDEGRLEDWLELFVPECLYWMPIAPGGGDPATEVTLAFDDRRRLEDRVTWLRSAYIWSQIPRSRTRRMLSNIEALEVEGGEIVARSNFVLFDVRPGYRAALPGWYAHRLRDEAGEWRIVTKTVHLLDSDQAHTNLSIAF